MRGLGLLLAVLVRAPSLSPNPLALSSSKGCPASVRCTETQGFDKLSLSGFGEQTDQASQQAGMALPAPRTLDDFSDTSRWEARASDGVTGTARPFEGGLRLDYDFARGSGYAFIRRALPLELPDNFEIRFRLRGAGPANVLEMKLTDASGDNVWWHRRADYMPPGAWQTIQVKRRQIDFAWGPTQDRTLRRAAGIEFVVAAGSGGGRGWIAVDDLEIVPLPVPPDVPPAIVAIADRGDGAALAADGDRATAWTAHAGRTIVFDLGYRREFGGLVLRWLPGRHASAYRVQLSDDRRAWRDVWSVQEANGGSDWIRLEESEARYVRIRLAGGPRDAGPDAVVALAELEVRPLAFGASTNAFVQAMAAEAPRGAFPRGYVGEQNYWTLVATPQGGDSGLMDEGGAVEVGRAGFSVEPFVLDGERLIGWADVEPEQSLAEDRLPIPSVRWRRHGWSLSTTAFATTDGIAWLHGRYVLRNEGRAPRELTLVLAVRPFQVNPPQQFLNIRGGVSPVRRLDFQGRVLRVNGTHALTLSAAPDRVVSPDFASGLQSEALFRTSGDPAVRDHGVSSAVHAEDGLASGAYLYRLRLAPGESRTIGWTAPLAEAPPRAAVPSARVEDAAADWRAALGDVRITGPPAVRPAIDTLYTALAHVLATREGAALRPGSRSYARSWIRDGAMMSTALLRMGIVEPVDRYLRWYAPSQYPSGKVPCCVDARGADPVPEHDSHGELIHLVAQLHLYAPDMARLREMWPRVRAAADHIEALRQSTRIGANRAGRNRPLFGLLPPSISHEGYSAKAAYSYWDNFWALTGLKDAVWLALELGRADEAALLDRRVEDYRGELLASITATRTVHGNAFIPGAADLGDFDATSTTIALSPGGEQHRLPQDMLAATFERYWQESLSRMEGGSEWRDYTPYEWRNVGALVRLGQRERALAMVAFFMAHRRPAAWNQWAEVVGRLPREARFIGDMPHGWVASDYIQAMLDMLAYERFDDQAMVLAAGLPDRWLADQGVGVERLRTPYGALSFRLRLAGNARLIDYALDGDLPPGGMVLASPDGEHRLPGRQGSVRIPLSGDTLSP